MAKAKKEPQTDITQKEREQTIIAAHAALKTAKTAKDVRNIWANTYLDIGHRVLGRLLLGQDVGSATRKRSQKE